MRLVYVEVLMLLARHVPDSQPDEAAYEQVADELVDKFGSLLLLAQCYPPEDDDD